MGIYDVPATELIEAIAQDLKTQGIEEPAWTEFVKSGSHRERAPQRRDWFYVRMASILYRAYKDGTIGTNRLRTYYGGKRNRGVKPHHFSKASGKVIRTCLQELEKKGLLKKEKAGRALSGKGQSFLIAKAKEVYKIFSEKVKADAKAIDDRASKAKAAAKPKAEAKVEAKPEEKPAEKAKEAAKPKAEAKPEAKAAKENPVPAKEEKKEPAKEKTEAKEPAGEKK